MRLLIILLLSINIFAVENGFYYNKLLSLGVCETGVNYNKIKGSNLVDKTDSEFNAITETDLKSWNHDRQIAWYINLYNFYTIKLIVDNYPVKSIKDIKSPWDRKTIPLFGKLVSLNYIEHKILRKEYREPRIHFALVCASIGCPSLSKTPFIGKNLDNQLNSRAKLFISDKSKNRIDKTSASISKIFLWYGNDFNEKYGGYKAYIKTLLKSDTLGAIKFNKYNWGLNYSSCGK